MTLAVTNYGNNSQRPGVVADAYIPDQLIAGDLKLVTEPITLTGSASLPRGAVLGQVKLGALSASTGTAAATGTIAVAALPADGDTVTIGGTAITFKTANPTGNQVLIGATVAATAQNLLAFLLGSLDTNLVKFRYTLATATITLTAAVLGTAGNSLTLATSNGTAFTVSGATLASGAANTGNATVGTISGGAQLKAGIYKMICLTATTAGVYDPHGNYLGVATFATPFTDAQITFTITAGGTPCVAGDTFWIVSAPATLAYKLAVSSAVDGSATPCGILVDAADASSADVLTAIYQMGEFNYNALTLGAGISLAALKAALTPLGIFIKSGAVSAADPS